MPVVTMRRIGARISEPRFADLDAAMAKAMRDFEKIAVEAHEETTQNWEHDVEFKSRRERWNEPGNDQAVVRVWTEDDVWHYVDRGTKPHEIRPRKAKVLAFPSVFTPKTQPRSLKSGSGSVAGPTVFSKGVRHPGTKARNFSAMLQRKLDNVYGVMINKVFAKFQRTILGQKG